ncbi:putative bifunctional diguanylate cyclase/phosphodiesterase [Gynuella sunshinyii]|uniref:Putative signal transduction protein containing a membrane domain, an EAL and a GGDEF domain n=1 Tax=Gynuella sunshinyii YC6258 TaxID=1445510 RepID=A0A0C5VDH7_9GAMM|nr:EAL domain-containing protein [Gynuella sunshinyii]AJQ92597.1 putative signal transduction protein containing a membrane domain, an EAL and a GGDEF domain [Gynuella sunshinyii YC6258]
MNITFFSSKLAKKTFLFLILAAFAPLVLIILVTYSQFSLMIDQHDHDQLKNVAKENALLIYGKLSFSRQLLAQIQPTESLDFQQSYLKLYFSALAEVQPEKRQLFWGHMDNRLLDQVLQVSDRQLLLRPDTDRSDIYLIVPSGMVAKVNPAYLWDETTTVLNSQPCILTNNYLPVHCPQHADIKPWLKKLQQAINEKQEIFFWHENDSTSMSYYWTLFMGHEFKVNNWIVIADKPISESLAVISQFRNIYFSVIALAILMVILLGSVLIRKNLDVITQLIQGTQRIKQRDFGHQIEVSGNDEFSQLASAFNSMSDSLHRSVREYTAFANIDRSILESVSGDRIIAAIFNSLYQIAPFHDLMMVNLTRQSSELNRLYYQKGSTQPILTGAEELEITSVLEQLPHDQLSYNLEINRDLEQLISLWQPTSKNICAIPVTRQDRLLAFIFATLTTAQPLETTITAQVLNFSQRTAVALYALEREAVFRHLARYDALTDIPNRVTLKHLFSTTLNTPGMFGAFLFIDLDRFKNINDTYGHLLGDSLLTKVAGRITTLLNKQETVARLSGDEFAVLVAGSIEQDVEKRVEDLCNGIINAINSPFHIDAHALHVGASIGVTLVPQHASDFPEALRCADTAMYASKKKGGNCFTFYTPEMSEYHVKRTILERHLRNAIGERNITLHYQPKVQSSNYAVSGFEALLRWNDPVYGPVSPFEVVTLAEEIGLITELGNLILELALEQWQHWIAQGYQPGSLAVNVSPLQLLSNEFTDVLTNVLRQNPLVPAKNLQLEITEGVMMHNVSQVLKTLADIRKLGIRIAIDDFGTGYSSLSYLIDIPADILKIDRSFVTKIASEEKPASLLGTVINLGHSLGYEIVAEGVETHQQADFLKLCQVEQLQGYLFSKALPVSEVEALYLKKSPAQSL